MKKIIILFILFVYYPSFSAENYSLTKLTEKHGVIWAMEFLSPDEIIFTERNGKIKILNLKNKIITEVKHNIDVKERGQGGLLDIQLDPEFSKNKIVYVTHTIETKPEFYTTALSSAEYKDKQLINNKKLFQAEPANKNSEHFGSRIQIQGDHIYFSVGERGERDLAQDLSTHLGKVLRINKDGTVPKDNPFVNQKNAKPEIWTYGHRNMQGLFLDKKTDQLWGQEHGPRGGDEINLIEKSKNYGWPVITYGKEYWGPGIGEKVKSGMEQPIYYYVPSIAPAGFIIYQGNVFKSWQGSFFSGALVLRHVNRLFKSGNFYKEERLFSNLGHKIREIAESPDGNIYFSTHSGEIYSVTSGEASKPSPLKNK